MVSILSIFSETRLCPARREHVPGDVANRPRCSRRLHFDELCGNGHHAGGIAQILETLDDGRQPLTDGDPGRVEIGRGVQGEDATEIRVGVVVKQHCKERHGLGDIDYRDGSGNCILACRAAGGSRREGLKGSEGLRELSQNLHGLEFCGWVSRSLREVW